MTSKIMVMTVMGLLAGPMAADAVPITYTFYDVSVPRGGQVAGSLGDLTFSGPNYELIFTFTGDTSNVVFWSVPLAKGGVQQGYEILVGTASVMLKSGNQVVAQGSFLPSDGIFVSVDNTGDSVGFGSGGVPQSSKGFPGQAVYPVGDLFPTGNPPVNMLAYDLKSDVPVAAGGGTTCVNFPVAPCSPSIPLATTAGDLVVASTNLDTPNCIVCPGDTTVVFTAELGPTAVPEPATLWLLGLGLAGVALTRIRRAPRTTADIFLSRAPETDGE